MLVDTDSVRPQQRESLPDTSFEESVETIRPRMPDSNTAIDPCRHEQAASGLTRSRRIRQNPVSRGLTGLVKTFAAKHESGQAGNPRPIMMPLFIGLGPNVA